MGIDIHLIEMYNDSYMTPQMFEKNDIIECNDMLVTPELDTPLVI